MPGTPGKGGHTPKRSTERMGHRSKTEKESVDKIQLPGLVKQPPPLATWNVIARDWYVALAASGQSKFFEPSDWAAARYIAEAVTRNLADEKRFSAQLFTGVWTAMNDLMTTEGSRRRLKLELERLGARDDGQVAANTAVLADYRKRIA